jgi:predicted nucleotide-binding protein (sugar kinase/HSP70/actin superfamily)
VISVAAGQSFQNEQKGFRLSWQKLANIAIYAVLYGDALYQMFNAISVREKEKGAAKYLFDLYMDSGAKAIKKTVPAIC